MMEMSQHSDSWWLEQKLAAVGPASWQLATGNTSTGHRTLSPPQLPQKLAISAFHLLQMSLDLTYVKDIHL